MDDFRKFATKHLGMSSMVLDDVIKSQGGYLNPYILEERQLNVTQLDVFSRLMMDRIIFLGEEVTDVSASLIVAQLLFLEAEDPDKDIHLYINSPGGSVTAGMSIFDTMQYIKCDVSTISIGLSASMGAFLLAAGEKGKRYALPYARVMIHQPLGGAQGQATDIEIHAREILRLREVGNEILARHTGQPIERIQQDTERDFFMSSDKAKEYGLIDSVVVRGGRGKDNPK